MFRRIVLYGVVLFTLMTAAFYFNPFGVFGERTYANTPGNQAPVVSGVDLNGSGVDVDFQGSVTVLNFWATWCPPCQAEMPEMERFYKENAGKIAFYAINLQEPSDRVGAFMKKSGYTMPVILDLKGEVAKKYRVSAIPTTIIVDKNGTVVFRQAGAMTKNDLDNALAIYK